MTEAVKSCPDPPARRPPQQYTVRSTSWRGRHPVTRLLVYAILILGTVVTLVPFIWILATSLKPASEIVRMPPTFFPENWTIQQLQDDLQRPQDSAGAFLSQQRAGGVRVV